MPCRSYYLPLEVQPSGVRQREKRRAAIKTRKRKQTSTNQSPYLTYGVSPFLIPKVPLSTSSLNRDVFAQFVPADR